jgi:hypothetical protein
MIRHNQYWPVHVRTYWNSKRFQLDLQKRVIDVSAHLIIMGGQNASLDGKPFSQCIKSERRQSKKKGYDSSTALQATV